MFQIIEPAQYKPLLASQWMHIDFLIDKTHFKNFLEAQAPVYFLPARKAQDKEKNAVIPLEDIYTRYDEYIEALKSEGILDEQKYKELFACTITRDTSAVCTLPGFANKVLFVAVKPTIQMQHHTLYFSKETKKVYPCVYGENLISWGLRCSYPRLFQDAQSGAIYNALDEQLFPNAVLWKELNRWLRQNSRYAHLIYFDERITTQARIGKECSDWISNHLQLKICNITCIAK